MRECEWVVDGEREGRKKEGRREALKTYVPVRRLQRLRDMAWRRRAAAAHQSRRLTLAPKQAQESPRRKGRAIGSIGDNNNKLWPACSLRLRHLSLTARHSGATGQRRAQTTPGRARLRQLWVTPVLESSGKGYLIWQHPSVARFFASPSLSLLSPYSLLNLSISRGSPQQPLCSSALPSLLASFPAPLPFGCRSPPFFRLLRR